MSKTQWEPKQYNHVADFVARLGEPLLELLAPKTSDHVLDVGCGDGKLTEKLVPLCAHVVGIDASAQMVGAARQINIDAHVKDAEQLDFNEQFDRIISNAALHWMLCPESVIDSIHRALKPRGVFVAEFGGMGNAQSIVDALTSSLRKRNIPFDNPWYFPSDAEYKALLEKHGFEVNYIELFDRLTPLPQHLHDWVLTFGQSFLECASEAQKQAILEEVAAQVAPGLLINGQWHVDYVRLRLKAVKRK
ncbi:methyltransferase domain-containing protein [Glaciecola sp. XM2]|jgi:trans-aconitate methyltransferase|uniref:class I SAM-dependent methyltransferase n=1 Tax=Glaciecola sp. XM2 TaxID=1914931 RepID=UPI001BDF261C|nr:class I SAM-dependent methyltransferase [Glaciecola sp. XM2]MBT1451778.1 methyltransferase domain-containing protein [Glaciecola sp. XM2]